jgi:CheY-like chemotaxis protein
MRVLVVDDEVNLRFAIERRLRKSGMEAVSASTVRQAIERLRAEAFDVVLCDLRMPGGDGTQLLQWLGSYSPSTNVIIVSAFVTPEIRKEYDTGTGLHILEKPVDLDDLLALLKEIGPRGGFFGNAIEVELFDYVQMIALCGRDKIIEVRTPTAMGLIWFEHGDIVHAEYGDFRGELAFYKMVAVNRGTFKEVFFRPPPMRTVTRSSTHLLMEAARQADEGTLGESPADGAPTVVADEISFAEVADEALADGLPDETSAPAKTAAPAETAAPARPKAAVHKSPAAAAPPAVAGPEVGTDLEDPVIDDELIGDDFVLSDDVEDVELFASDGVPEHQAPVGSGPVSAEGWDEVLDAGDAQEATIARVAPVKQPPKQPARAQAKQTGRGRATPVPEPPQEPAPSPAASGAWGQHAVIDDDATRKQVLEQFRAVEGVNGVAIISNTGKVLADDMADSSALVTLAGFYMRGAARVARTLGYNVYDGVIARATSGQQMILVTTGPTSAVLSVEIGCDPEQVRAEVMRSG